MWRRRPVAARVVVVAASAIPLAAAVIGAATARIVLRGRGVPVVAAWLLATTAAAVGYWLADRVCRRLLPLSLLLRLSLAFPDHTPSRLGVALKAGSTKRLLRAERSSRLRSPANAEQVLALAASIATHDRGTRGHSERVRAYAELLADELGLDEQDHDRLRWAALLHDVGKLAVPATILNATQPLTDEEWETIRRHPTEGARLTAPLQAWLGTWAAAVAQHHERWDGKGYPNGLAGEELSLAGRIVTVADSYDAMTAERSYSKAMTAKAARQELVTKAGTQFDPGVVRAFLSISIGRLRWIIGPAALFAVVPGLAVVRRAGSGVRRSAVVAGATLTAAVLSPLASTAPLSTNRVPSGTASRTDRVAMPATTAPSLVLPPETSETVAASSPTTTASGRAGATATTRSPATRSLAPRPPGAAPSSAPAPATKPPARPAPLCSVSLGSDVCAGFALERSGPLGTPSTATIHAHASGVADVTATVQMPPPGASGSATNVT